MSKRKVEIYRAMKSFSYDDEHGSPVTVKTGDLVRRGHPVLKGREALFQPVDDRVRFDVEEATAAPGEKRGPQGATRSEPAKPAEKPAEPAQANQGGVKGGSTQGGPKGITSMSRR